MDYFIKKYSLIKPDILVIGTSTSQHLPHSYLEKNIMNINSIDLDVFTYELLLNKLYKIHKPEVIVFGVDWWRFNKNIKINSNQSEFKSNLKYKNKNIFNFSLQNYLDLIKFIKKNKIYIFNYKNNNNIGIASNFFNEGYDLRGNYYHTRLLKKELLSFDENFKTTEKQLNKEIFFFQSFDLNLKMIRELKKINEDLKKKDIKFILIFPPVSPYIYSKKKFRKHKENIIKVIKNLDNQFKIYNYVNRDYFDNCNFLDGMHAGDNLLLKVFSEVFYKEGLIKFNKKYEDIFISNLKKTTLPNNYKVLEKRDILNQGC